MKCPKCGYLGFETSDRCRNCGYDFSLAVSAERGPELPLHSAEGAGEALADFDLSGAAGEAPALAHLDLDRLIGADVPAPPAPRSRRGAAHVPAGSEPAARAVADPLPLFSHGDADDAPLVPPPRPARPPLSVRRTTPDVPRGRVRGTRTTPVPQDDAAAPGSSLLADAGDAPERDLLPPARHVQRAADSEAPPAAAGARLAAAGIDLLLIALIDAAVIYLTLALVRLGTDALATLPLLPLAAFLVLLNGGYLIAFVAAGGQTIGKMATGIRVMGDDGRRVDVSGAVLRALGCLLSVTTAGLGYLPAFVTADKRAVHDRIAGTRVVSAR